MDVIVIETPQVRSVVRERLSLGLMVHGRPRGQDHGLAVDAALIPMVGSREGGIEVSLGGGGEWKSIQLLLFGHL